MSPLRAEQRQKLLESMIAELAEGEYADFPLLAALGRAGVGMDAFEAEFGGLDECLYAAYDRLTDGLIEAARSGCETEGDWPAQVRGGLARLLDSLSGEPAVAQVLVRKFPAVRPSAYQRYTDFLSDLAALLRAGRSFSRLGEELPQEVELLAVGAAEAIVFAEIDAGRAADLPGMLPEILFSVLVPFIGPEQASEEMRDAAVAR